MNRRRVLQAMLMGGGASVLNLGSYKTMVALAQNGGSDYKALVCVFFFGGNDTNNLLVPIDNRYTMYAGARQQLSITQGSLLPLTGTPFGLHPSLSHIQSLFNQGHAAVITNMGPLIQPTTMSQYQAKAVDLPANLRSHPDQRNCMATALRSSGFAPGWGGRIADVLGQRPAGSLPMAMSLTGPTPFVNGVQSHGYYPGGTWNCSEGKWCSAIDTAVHQVGALQSNSALVQADQEILSGIEAMNNTYAKAIASASIPSVPALPNSNGLADELLQVARIMSIRNALQASRQIFIVGLGGFDTHSNQLGSQGPLLQGFDQAIGIFWNVLQEMNLADSVTTYTASEFSRTLQSNGGGGSDHGWGAHHVVIGGAVNGGQIYGTFPTLQCGGPDDIDINGVWLPSTSLNQYAATLAQWFGVPKTSMAQVLPDIVNFPVQTLGFV